MVKIFAVWLLIANINYLYDDPEQRDDKRCVIVFNNGTNGVQVKGHTCDEVAAEINKYIPTSKAGDSK